jgi:hypothetical protein
MTMGCGSQGVTSGTHPRQVPRTYASFRLAPGMQSSQVMESQTKLLKVGQRVRVRDGLFDGGHSFTIACFTWTSAGERGLVLAAYGPNYGPREVADLEPVPAVFAPTLNPEYNELLARWEASGHGSPPECEDCGCDLTGKAVVDDGCMWVCEACSELPDDAFPLSERDLQAWERKQMGIGS